MLPRWLVEARKKGRFHENRTAPAVKNILELISVNSVFDNLLLSNKMLIMIEFTGKCSVRFVLLALLEGQVQTDWEIHYALVTWNKSNWYRYNSRLLIYPYKSREAELHPNNLYLVKACVCVCPLSADSHKFYVRYSNNWNNNLRKDNCSDPSAQGRDILEVRQDNWHSAIRFLEYTLDTVTDTMTEYLKITWLNVLQRCWLCSSTSCCRSCLNCFSH